MWGDPVSKQAALEQSIGGYMDWMRWGPVVSCKSSLLPRSQASNLVSSRMG